MNKKKSLQIVDLEKLEWKGKKNEEGGQEPFQKFINNVP